MFEVLLIFVVYVLSQQYDLQGSVQKTKNGLEGSLALSSGRRRYRNFNPPDVIRNLSFQFFFETENRVRLQIKDSSADRWEVPDIVISKTPEKAPATMNYEVDITSKPFSFRIVRKSDGYEIFNTKGFNFYYADQYIEITTSLGSTSPNIYGLGERVFNFRLDPNNVTYVIFNRDQGTPVKKNLYGTHPFYLELLSSGNSHGSFFLNSNAQEYQLDGDQLTYRTIGGILDMFFFMGDSPKKVIQQYHEVIGNPYFPPEFSIGYHHCRWGYTTVRETSDVVKNFSKFAIPLETMWNDIDFMDQYKDWTSDPVNFPLEDLQSFVKSLHDNHQHYIQILDPGIKVEQGYEPYDEGRKLNVFIKENNTVHDLIGKVWPGYCVFTDFSNPQGPQYFQNELKNCDGECQQNQTRRRRRRRYLTSNYENPPYVPGGTALDTSTIRMDGMTKLGVNYNVHSLYGFQESVAVNQFLQDFHNKRPVLITRSSFAGSGRVTGHWLGDNSATWDDLYYSISGTMSMGLFGISFVGVDICGFGGNTNAELCTRWYELGAFYPFMRNHNSIDCISQEPYALGPQVLETSKKMIHLRYRLLPYLYTMMYHASVDSRLVVFQPLLMEFPTDTNVAAIDKQFMWGSGMMVSPVLTQGATTVDVYVPDAVWYDYYTFAGLIGPKCPKTKNTCTLAAPLGTINIHIRGGNVIPRKVNASQSALTVYDLRRSHPFEYIIALDENGDAEGDLYVDDGSKIPPLVFTLVSIKCESIAPNKTYKVSATALKDDYSGPEENMGLQQMFVLGVASSPESVTFQGKSWTDFSYESANGVLLIKNLGVKIQDFIVVEFSL